MISCSTILEGVDKYVVAVGTKSFNGRITMWWIRAAFQSICSLISYNAATNSTTVEVENQVIKFSWKRGKARKEKMVAKINRGNLTPIGKVSSRRGSAECNSGAAEHSRSVMHRMTEEWKLTYLDGIERRKRKLDSNLSFTREASRESV